MQLLNEQIKFLIGFVRFFESKTLKTLILDTFASENTIKPLFFLHFWILEGWVFIIHGLSKIAFQAA